MGFFTLLSPRMQAFQWVGSPFVAASIFYSFAAREAAAISNG
jgi:hypothetical protein